MLGAVVREKINEASDLSRQMMAVRIDGVHRKFHGPVFGKDADKPARLKIGGDQKSGASQIPTPCRAEVRSVSPLLEIRLPEIRTDAGASFRSTKRHSSS